MFETINKIDEEIVTKDKNKRLTRKPTASLLSGNVEYLYENDTSLMIEAGITKKNIRKLKNNSVFLFNYV